MRKRIPIACTLEPGAEAQSALDRYRELFAAALVGAERMDNGVRWILRSDDDVAAQVRSLAAMEEQCCAFLEMAITASDETIVWEVTGSDDARAFLDEYMKLAELAS